MLINYFKKVFYLVVSISFMAGSILAHAGVYEDFFQAIKADDSAKVQSLLAQGFDPNAVDEKGQAALYLGLRDGSFKVCAALLDHPQIRIDQPNGAGETPLMMAALRGHAEWAGRLLDRGARLNGADNGDRPGWTALHYAATGPDQQTVALLLARGARVDLRSPNGSTPLMMAAGYGTEAAARQLLQKGADPRLKNDQGLSAADFAAKAGRDVLARQLQAASR
jgi:ankyrin repeat protein